MLVFVMEIVALNIAPLGSGLDPPLQSQNCEYFDGGNENARRNQLDLDLIRYSTAGPKLTLWQQNDAVLFDSEIAPVSLGHTQDTVSTTVYITQTS